MKKVDRQDVLDLAAYEKVRAESRRRVIEIKKRRRVSLGDRVTLVFENRATVISQIQEMMRTEYIYDEGKILHEMETYNQLLPEDGEVSATLFIEIVDQDRIREEMDRFRGIDSGKALYIRMGDRKAFARFESGRSNEEKLSAVHYIRFPLRDSLYSGGDLSTLSTLFKKAEVRLVLDHPGFLEETVLSPELKEELLQDLR